MRCWGNDEGMGEVESGERKVEVWREGLEMMGGNVDEVKRYMGESMKG